MYTCIHVHTCTFIHSHLVHTHHRYKAYFKAIFKGQGASARNELTAARQALGKAEDDVATRRGVRALQRTSASPGHQQLPVSDKLSGARGGDGSTRRRHGGADGDGVGADPLLAKLDKAVRDHEVALASTLTRMSELAVKHVRREELLRLEKGLANLEQQVKDLLDAPSGAAKSELTNARVREVRGDGALVSCYTERDDGCGLGNIHVFFFRVWVAPILICLPFFPHAKPGLVVVASV